MIVGSQWQWLEVVREVWNEEREEKVVDGGG